MPRQINVITSTQRISVNPTSNAVSVILAGPQGPAGEVLQSVFDAAVANLQSQIDDLQSQIDSNHP